MSTRTITVTSLPESVPFSEPEPTTAEPIPEQLDVKQGFSIAEPLPQWDEALKTWKWAWDLHWAGLGTLFSLVALYAVWSIVIMGSGKNKRRQPLSLAINILLIILGSTRALFLFINPYESEQCNISKCPTILTRLLYGMGLPSLSAAFSLIQLMFFQLTKLTLYPRRLQSVKLIISLITVHFAIAVIAEIIIFAHADWRSLALVCQGFFIIFCFLLSTSFVYSGYKVIKYAQKNIVRMQSIGVRVSSKRGMRNGKDNSGKDFRPNITKLVKITYVTAALGISGVTLQLYAIFHVYNLYIGEYPQPEPWPWLVFQSLFRIVELLASCTMAYVGRRQVWNKSLLFHSCMSCVNRGLKKCELSILNSTESDRIVKMSIEKIARQPSLSAVEIGVKNNDEKVSKTNNGFYRNTADNPLFSQLYIGNLDSQQQLRIQTSSTG